MSFNLEAPDLGCGWEQGWAPLEGMFVAELGPDLFCSPEEVDYIEIRCFVFITRLGVVF